MDRQGRPAGRRRSEARHSAPPACLATSRPLLSLLRLPAPWRWFATAPDTVVALVAWFSLTLAQRRPAFTSTVSISPRVTFVERAPNSSFTVSASTAAPLASPGRRIASSSDESPFLFALKALPGIRAIAGGLGSVPRDISDSAINESDAQSSETDRSSDISATTALASNTEGARQPRHSRTMAPI